MARRITGPTVLTRAQVARALGVHPATVSRWARSGALRCFHTPSGQRRYRRCDVEEFLNNPQYGKRLSPVGRPRTADPADQGPNDAPADHTQSCSCVPGRSRMSLSTVSQAGGMDAGDCTVAAAQAIPAEAA